MNEKRSDGILPSAADAIGWTPLVALDRITAGMDGRILAKLEMLNPGYSMPVLDHMKEVSVDGFLEVTGDEATECTRRLAREEGLFAGYSSGANLAGALNRSLSAKQGLSR